MSLASFFKPGRLITTSLIVFISLGASVCPVFGAQKKAKKVTRGKVEQTHPDWKAIEKELRKEKFDSKFIAFLKKHFDADQNDPVLNLNILSFLMKIDHQDQVTSDAVVGCHEFMIEHKADLELAQKKFKVEPEYIAALLWIETRLGKMRGKFHVPSVFAALIGSRAKTFQNRLVEEGRERRSDGQPTMAEIRKKVKERTKAKAKWASEELKEVRKIYKRDPEFVENWLGSFAGAFGIPQFIPSSYAKYAYTDRIKGKKMALPNLSDPHDAILSVANYLAKHHWGKYRINKEKALFTYNKSVDYGQAILSLGDLARAAIAESPNRAHRW